MSIEREPEVVEPGAAEPGAAEAGVTEPDVRYDTADYQVPATRSARRRRRVTPMGLFAVAFVALLLAGVSVGVANFNPGSTRFAWTSLGLSCAAVVLTAAALFLRPRR
jgi:hypothetical protein